MEVVLTGCVKPSAASGYLLVQMCRQALIYQEAEIRAERSGRPSGVQAIRSRAAAALISAVMSCRQQHNTSFTSQDSFCTQRDGRAADDCPAQEPPEGWTRSAGKDLQYRFYFHQKQRVPSVGLAAQNRIRTNTESE